MPAPRRRSPIAHDTAFCVALILAAFTILFGTRHLDATERHEGMVAAIAFESLVKLRRIPRRRRLRHLRDVSTASATCSRAPRQRPDSRRCCAADGGAGLRQLGVAHRPVDVGDHVPAAAVPGGRGRERRRAPPAHGDLAVPAVHARDQPLRAAHRVRRLLHFGGDAVDADTFVLTLPMARAARAARAAGVHRRPLRRDRHDHRRDHRAVDDGVQRPPDAGAAAAAAAAPPERPTWRGCCSRSAAARSCR